MISLFGTTDVLRIVTSSTANIDVVGTYVTNSEPATFGAITAKAGSLLKWTRTL